MSLLAHRDIPVQSRMLVSVAFALGAAFCGVIVLFVAAQILTDPGGLQGLLFVVGWLALPAALTVLALVAPRIADPVLVGMVGLVLLAALVTIPLAGPVWEFEDTHGPINLMVLLGAVIPLVALGRARPLRAGWLLIALMGGFLVLQAISLGIVDEWSVILVFAVLLPPLVIVAVLYVIAGERARRDSNPQPTG